ncbi:MAG: 3-hydroxyacyl-CoA dehydrogenase NAD-binding domain-containing protein, partial [Pseudomonadota bacterium]|nr:3-hydroxyacyl-CoA dehydrogenase NAD-binding domain-containing protein [Pseudomonadota bacterium]
GGGLELALGCHYRLASSEARLALPEVKLGLIPGAGGTQRLPRLVGIDVAIDLVTSGRPVGADEAAALGLVDALIEGDAIEFAVDFANRGSTQLPVPLSQRASPEGPPTSVFVEKRVHVVRRARGQESPLKALESIEFGLSVPFEEGLRNERAVFQALRTSPQSRALRHAFFAERAVAKIPGLENTHPRDIQHLGIVGGGTMGIGIAVCALKAGFNVVLLERTLAESARAREGIAASLQEFVERTRMTSSDHTVACQRLVTDTDYDCLSTAELIIEAVFEDMDLKKQIFTDLDRIAKPGAILATNTSALNIDEIASVTKRPEDVIGLHFFSPAQLMRLLEVVKGEKTDSHVVATCLAFARRLDKVGVLAGVCDGFIGNRILFHYRKQVDYMLEDGAMPWEIDQAMELFGMAMGPFRVMDQAGLDIGWANRQRLAPTRARRERYVEIADRLCERGWFGRKSGRGWYVYQADGTITGYRNGKPYGKSYRTGFQKFVAGQAHLAFGIRHGTGVGNGRM